MRCPNNLLKIVFGSCLGGLLFLTPTTQAATDQTSQGTVNVINSGELDSVHLESVPEVNFEKEAVETVTRRAVQLDYQQIRSASNDSRGHIVVSDLRPTSEQAADPWQLNAQLTDVICTNQPHTVTGVTYTVELAKDGSTAEIGSAATKVWTQPKAFNQHTYTQNVADAHLKIPVQQTAHAGKYHAAVVWTLVNSLGQGVADK